MEKLLTISVAAYNVEKYLEKLLASIVSTDRLEAIEVLIVNDGSKDTTSQIAHSYQQKYPDSIRVIDKENGGHGSTINCGIQNATGKYFRALDGDDWVHSEHLSSLVDKMSDINTDIILSDYCKCYEDGREIVGNEFTHLEDGKEYSFDEIANLITWMRYHTVIYRTKILKENAIHLDEHCFYVDREFMLYPIPFTNNIFYFKKYIYCYRLGLTDQSVSPESRMKHIDNGLTVTKSLLDFWKEEQNNLSDTKKKYIIAGIKGHCVWHYDSLLLFPVSQNQKRDIIQYDKMIKDASNDIYMNMEAQNRKIKVMRKTCYSIYSLLHWYVLRKELA